MERLTAEKIAALAEDKTGLAERRKINSVYRAFDDSHLWPTNGRFNVTERAIRQARQWQRDSGVSLTGIEYCLFLEDLMSHIVNDERNW